MNPDDNDLLDQLKMTEALYAIALESDEADIVRIAFIGLVTTEAGRQYLKQNPPAVG